MQKDQPLKAIARRSDRGQRRALLPEQSALARVLVATDFSPGGLRAVERAVQLPLKSKSVLTILHVAPPTGEEGLDVRLAHETRLALDRSRAAAVRTARASGWGEIEIRTIGTCGNVIDEIVGHAESTHAELVVMGRLGWHRFKKLFLGSTAERVIRQSGIPVLVVGSALPRPYRHPLAAIDFSDSSRRALALARRLQHPGEDEVEALHVYDIPFDRRIERILHRQERSAFREAYRRAAHEKMDDWLGSMQDPKARWRVVLGRGDPRKIILEHARRRRTDLIAVGSNDRSGIARLRIGSVALAVVRYASCDVLVVRSDMGAGTLSQRY